MKFLKCICFLIVGCGAADFCFEKANSTCTQVWKSYPTKSPDVNYCRRMQIFQVCMQLTDDVCGDYFTELIYQDCFDKILMPVTLISNVGSFKSVSKYNIFAPLIIATWM
ncbi:uncharacterized protein LOC128249883 [Octopus bimaculoides]|uniref:uncharacterized protein LOC128249883 n=1 Tax=Octopus bimaculoides TaxID=37653 RepID=UPI0022E024F6|nr:uncharacterized protein LOC128249883 [Octopus bimaculoides]